MADLPDHVPGTEPTLLPAAGLLARYARLAALAAGTTAGLVETPGELVTAGLAEAPEHGWATRMMDARPDARIAVVADPCAWGGPAQAQFAACLPALAPTGERVGVICVVDTAARAALTPAEAAALADVATLAGAAMDQATRYRGLLEVTDRAARADRMLRMVTEAGSCEDALTQMLGELCVHHGAAVGRIWKLTMPGGMMQEISRFADDALDNNSYYKRPPAAPVRAGNSMTAEAIRGNRPQAFVYSAVTDRSRYVLLQNAIDAGLRSQVSYPVWVQDQRFGVALAFTSERPDLEAIVADVASMASSIRPALFRRVTEDRIRFMAHHDELTRLCNRSMFNETLQHMVDAARRDQTGVGLLYLDLDGFKMVNDSRGHEVGDRLLAAVAARLRGIVREGDTVARIGGDEFAIIQPDGGQPHAVTQLADRLLEALATPFDIDGQASMIGASIGIALFPAHGGTPDVLRRHADAALYEAKQSGRNTFRLFEQALGVAKQERLLIERDLKGAIDRQELTLSYQPICDVQTLRVRGLEALMRWTHPTRGPLPPSRFVPMAEAAGLIVPLGDWVLRTACAEAAGWARPLCVSINFSPMQFRQPRLAQQIEQVLRDTGLPPQRLDLEVTEGLLLDHSGTVLRTMHELREQGVRITLDDFGTAYASLGYLRRFPFDRIKIDQSFVQAMCEDDGTLAIVQAILSLSARLGLEVVAEGVETRQELAVLQDLSCSLVQGYLTGRPMPREAVRVLLDRPPGDEAPAP